MAGIGWRLERLIDRGTLSGAAAAYATGASIMALPWVLTTTVLLSLPAILGRATIDFANAETTVSIAYLVALLVDGPLQIVLSRYVADRLYEKRLAAIRAPFCRGLGAVLVLCGATAAAALWALGLPPISALWGGSLSASVGAAWTALSVGSGLCSPGLVLGSVAAGAAVGLLGATLLVAGLGLGVPGYLFGLISGQVLTLTILLVGILRALPERADEDARLLPAFREYATLAGSGLAFNAALWVDKFITAQMAGARSAAPHSAASTVAWFATIPCLAWIFVEVETSFHRRFRSFYRSLLNGATLTELRRGVRMLQDETTRLLRGAVSMHAGATIVLQIGATSWIEFLHLPPDTVLPFRFLLIGAGMLALSLLGLIILYYFDLRRDALLAATALFGGIVFFTTLACQLHLPPSLGTALGAGCGTLVTWQRVRRGVQSLLSSTLLGQPFGTERLENLDLDASPGECQLQPVARPS